MTPDRVPGDGEAERVCGAVYRPHTANVLGTNYTYSPPMTCELSVNHDDPMHRAGEGAWQPVECARGRADSEEGLGA